MAADLVWAYEKAGGRELLLKIALENPIAFLQQGLSRLLPQPIKEDGPDILIQQQFNALDAGTDLDAARRISFLLSKAASELGDDASGTDLAPYTYQPARPYERDCNPQEACRADPDPAREAWAADLALTEDEKLIRETQTASIENYRGGAGEGLVDRPRRKRELL
jgi:hypothetical protein